MTSRSTRPPRSLPLEPALKLPDGDNEAPTAANDAQLVPDVSVERVARDAYGRRGLVE
jgi:hypothetical protein